jgi:SOS-response transcriptional repressor LexA
MRGIPEEVQPSNLLWIDELCQSAEELKKNCCNRFSATDDPRLLEVWAKDAEVLLLPDQQNDYAIILICLADKYHELNCPNQALNLTRKAEGHFCPYPKKKHQHNCAVAHYAVGLAHQSVNEDVNALRYYDNALGEFKKAKEMWQHERDKDMIEQCGIAIHWLEKLRRCLARARADGRPPNKTSLPVLSRIAASEPMLAGEEFDEWEDVDIADTNGANFILKVKGDSMHDASRPDTDIRDGDLVLIEQRNDPPSRADQIVAVIIEGVDSEATLKRFYQEKDHVRLEPASDTYPFIIVKPDSLPKGAIHDRYAKSHPGRHLDIHSGVNVQIAGWYRGKVCASATP